MSNNTQTLCTGATNTLPNTSLKLRPSTSFTLAATAMNVPPIIFNHRPFLVRRRSLRPLSYLYHLPSDTCLLPLSLVDLDSSPPPRSQVWGRVIFQWFFPLRMAVVRARDATRFELQVCYFFSLSLTSPTNIFTECMILDVFNHYGHHYNQARQPRPQQVRRHPTSLRHHSLASFVGGY